MILGIPSGTLYLRIFLIKKKSTTGDAKEHSGLLYEETYRKYKKSKYHWKHQGS